MVSISRYLSGLISGYLLAICSIWIFSLFFESNIVNTLGGNPILVMINNPSIITLMEFLIRYTYFLLLPIHYLFLSVIFNIPIGIAIPSEFTSVISIVGGVLPSSSPFSINVLELFLLWIIPLILGIGVTTRITESEKSLSLFPVTIVIFSLLLSLVTGFIKGGDILLVVIINLLGYTFFINNGLIPNSYISSISMGLDSRNPIQLFLSFSTIGITLIVGVCFELLIFFYICKPLFKSFIEEPSSGINREVILPRPVIIESLPVETEEVIQEPLDVQIKKLEKQEEKKPSLSPIEEKENSCPNCGEQIPPNQTFCPSCGW
ncbi:MAG: zinc ribbon domain-containing protein [Candidatus Ranarchaeia archaeon]